MKNTTPSTQGVLFAVATYTIWGLLPVFWKALGAVPAPEILSHRVVWSLVFVWSALLVAGRWSWLGEILKNRKAMLTFLAAGALLGVNWLTYIWAVNAGFIVETSLGYFINPLVSVLMGVVFLKERLRRWQWLPIALAALGVLYLTVSYGQLPWIALVLAGTFGFYGLLKKTSALKALRGLALEMGVMSLPAFTYLAVLHSQGAGSFGNLGMRVTLLLILTGVATSLPLLMFARAAQSIPLYLVGILQYIAPTLQFLLGVYVYNEPFTTERLIGFSMIWIALLIYTLEGMLTRRAKTVAQYAD